MMSFFSKIFGKKKKPRPRQKRVKILEPPQRFVNDNVWFTTSTVVPVPETKIIDMTGIIERAGGFIPRINFRNKQIYGVTCPDVEEAIRQRIAMNKVAKWFNL
jgi:hypothetical protein